MGTEAVTYYRAVCDGCGADLTAIDGSEHSAWSDESSALEYAEGYQVGDDWEHLLCTACVGRVSSAYAEVEWLLLTEPPTEPQGQMAWLAALGFLRAPAPSEED